MIIKMFSYYKDFRCIADSCSDSCCDGWKIIIDKISSEKYLNTENVLAWKLKDKLVVDKDNNYFKLDGSRCPFLNEDNLCDIYINMGEKALSSTCSSFPRIIRKDGNVMQACLTLACPQAARMMLENKLDITTMSGVNDNVDAMIEDRIQTLLIDIVNDSSISWKKRMIILIVITKQISKAEEGVLDIIEQFEDKSLREEFAESIQEDYDNEQIKAQMMYDIINEYMKMCFSRIHESETIDLLRKYVSGKNVEDIQHLYNDYDNVMEQSMLTRWYEFENFITYYIFRYFKETPRENLFDRIAMMFAEYSIIRTLDMMCLVENGDINIDNQIEIMHYCAKILEHSKKDYNIMYNLMKESGYITMAHLTLLM